MEQNFTPQNNDSPQSFEEFENKQAEDIFSAYFSDCSEEEQLLLRELGSKFNIRANDSLWSFAGVLLFFGRSFNKLPQKVKDAVLDCQNEIIELIRNVAASTAELEAKNAQSSLSETLQQIISQQKKVSWLHDLFLPLACSCLGVFCLCLISFVAGAAIAGKGWGHSTLEALLNAPAGWIIPLALIPVAGITLYQGLTEQGKNRYLNLTVSLVIAVGVLCVLTHIL